MASLFISYSRTDSAFAHKLHDAQTVLPSSEIRRIR
jgi:hypothetical protein